MNVVSVLLLYNGLQMLTILRRFFSPSGNLSYLKKNNRVPQRNRRAISLAFNCERYVGEGPLYIIKLNYGQF